MNSATLPELKEEELRAFLKENLYANVGTPVSASSCPITMLYWEKHGIVVTTTRSKISHYCLLGKRQEQELSPWATNFVRLLDRKHKGRFFVTGEEALEVLDAALLEAKA